MVAPYLKRSDAGDGEVLHEGEDDIKVSSRDVML